MGLKEKILQAQPQIRKYMYIRYRCICNLLELHELSVIYCYGIIDQLLYYSTKISRFTKAILILIKANEHYIKHSYKQTCNNSLKILNLIYYNAILQQVLYVTTKYQNLPKRCKSKWRLYTNYMECIKIKTSYKC